MAEKKSVIITIKRQDTPTSKSYWEEFELAWHPGMNVISSMMEIAANPVTRQLYNMLQLARVVAQGARMRDESRGAHYKPDFPERDDKNWLKTTKAYFAPDADEPKFEFEPVDTSLIPPRPRKYDAAK